MERLLPEFSEPILDLVKAPPPPSSWVDGKVLAELDDTIFDVYGENVLASTAHETTKRSLAPILRAVAESWLRLFGTSPRTLLSRLGALSASTVRGVSFGWRDTDARAGEMLVTYDDSRDVPQSAFVAIGAGLVNIFEMCGTTGTVALGDASKHAPRNRAPFVCRW